MVFQKKAGKGNPEIITGPRNESDYPDRPGEGADSLPKVPARQAAGPAPRPGVRRFVADSPGYRLQLDCTDDIIVQGVGKIPGRSRAIQFVNGAYETDDPELIALIEKSKSYGMGRSICDSDELRTVAEDKSYESFVEQLEKNPRLKERLAVDPRLKSFAQEGAPAGA